MMVDITNQKQAVSETAKTNEVEIKLKLSEDLLKLDSISKIPEASLMYIRKACGLNTAIWSTAEMKLQEE
ncbi:hypothetical protein [Ruminococcus flavefaciens]|uniref:hypothetical protein n=1 Tax=Ruminococcus flavefaciens TaxID=1265 RepID=UPI0026EE5553|nr:hypothetical protein [Ruminococcus flavefaciens]